MTTFPITKLGGGSCAVTGVRKMLRLPKCDPKRRRRRGTARCQCDCTGVQARTRRGQRQVLLVVYDSYDDKRALVWPSLGRRSFPLPIPGGRRSQMAKPAWLHRPPVRCVDADAIES